MKEQLAQEWTTLQNNHEAYERSALLIKLAAVALVAIAALDPLVVAVLVLVLWLQEAVLKTWQGRLAERLITLEVALKGENQKNSEPAFQLHSQWRARRPGLAGLLTQYGRSALRPTVAFPYALLLLLVAML